MVLLKLSTVYKCNEKLLISDQMKRMVEILGNKFYSLRLGHIGVYNMSPTDIQEKKSVQNVLKEQKEFFERYKIFEWVYT